MKITKFNDSIQIDLKYIDIMIIIIIVVLYTCFGVIPPLILISILI